MATCLPLLIPASRGQSLGTEKGGTHQWRCPSKQRDILMAYTRTRQDPVWTLGLLLLDYLVIRKLVVPQHDNLIIISDENIIWNIVLRVYPDIGPGTILKTELLDVFEAEVKVIPKRTMAWSSPNTEAWALLAQMAHSLRYFRRKAASSSDRKKRSVV